MDTITKNEIKMLLPKRPSKSHKGTFGKVMIVAGSLGMAGAPVLSARSAMRSGSGLVRVSIDETLFPIIHYGVPEAICGNRNFDKAVLDEQDAIGIGPGMGLYRESWEALKRILELFQGKIVLDADALRIIAEGNFAFSSSDNMRIITPHAGEAARLLGIDIDQVNSDREMSVLSLARKYNCISVLKGHQTLVAEPGGDIFINITGNPGMATAGSGDVLTGMIASFLGQGMNPKDAALAGVYVHGFAGDIAAEEKGTYGLIASDIIEAIPKAIMQIQE